MTYTNDGKTLIQHGQCGLATCQTGVQQSQTRNDHPDKIGADGQVDGVEFETSELGIDIDLERISAIGGGLVKFRLRREMSARSDLDMVDRHLLGPL